jgi:hypothetical protein
MMCHSRRPSFVRDQRALNEARLEAKLAPCTHCARTGMVIGHGMFWGHAERSGAVVLRGRHFVCSNRARRTGCGCTFSIRIANVIAHSTVRTDTLSRLLTAVVQGLSRKAAWERERPAGLCLRSGYRLWRRLLAAHFLLRATLLSKADPTSCHDPRPLAQLLEHLHSVLGNNECVLASFQHEFQRHLFG